MKALYRTVATLAAVHVLAAGAVQAQVFHNTGEPGSLNASFEDAFWQISNDFGATWIQAFQVQSPPSSWEPSTSTYSWISSALFGSGSGPSYRARTFFDLTGYDLTTVSLSFQCAIDNNNDASEFISLNGGAYGGTCGSGPTTTYQFAGVQTYTTGFVSGINEIDFQWGGDTFTDGLVVGNSKLTGTVATAPEPASIALVATGLLGVFGVARRRRNRTRA